MKRVFSNKLTIGCLLWVLIDISPAAAQKPVNGNGNIIEQIRPLSNFSAVLIDFSADVTIANGETPSFRIEADENVLPFIGTKVRGRKLMITQDRWIEPSQRVVIQIGVPFTAKLETSGYSNVAVENIDGPRLQVDAGVGDVSLHGKTDRVQIRTKTGNIDATDLEAAYVDVAVSSHGVVKLGEVQELLTNVADNGTVVYAGEPDDISNRNKEARVVSDADYEEPVAAEVQYIDLVLVNNSRKRLNLRVEGPSERSFGYGFPLPANGRRKESWPVGSKVYTEGRILADKLLVTLTADMADENVYLFKKD